MITRRHTFGFAAALGATALLADRARARTEGVGFSMPTGACDSHVHVFLDPVDYPLAPGRLYTPPVATTEALIALHGALGIDRTVLVAPSVYGSDMRPTLEAMRRIGRDRARGVTVYSPETTTAELSRLHDAGMRGMRVNLEMIGVTSATDAHDVLTDAAAQAASRGWHLQVSQRLSILATYNETFHGLTVPLVFDHFAGARAALGSDQPGLAMVMDLVRNGRAYVKLSAAYRASTAGPDYADLDWLAQALIAVNPDRMLWGSDWPHPGGAVRPEYRPEDIMPAYAVDDARVLSRLGDWAPDAAVRRRILVDNPRRLYGFG